MLRIDLPWTSRCPYPLEPWPSLTVGLAFASSKSLWLRIRVPKGVVKMIKLVLDPFWVLHNFDWATSINPLLLWVGKTQRGPTCELDSIHFIYIGSSMDSCRKLLWSKIGWFSELGQFDKHFFGFKKIKLPADCRGDLALCSRPLGRVPCEGNQRKEVSSQMIRSEKRKVSYLPNDIFKTVGWDYKGRRFISYT